MKRITIIMNDADKDLLSDLANLMELYGYEGVDGSCGMYRIERVFVKDYKKPTDAEAIGNRVLKYEEKLWKG